MFSIKIVRNYILKNFKLYFIYFQIYVDPNQPDVSVLNILHRISFFQKMSL